MSALLYLTDAAAHQAAVTAQGAVQAGVLDWVSDASGRGQDTLKAVGGLAAVGFVLITAWKTRGAIAGVIAGAVAAFVFFWLLNNVTEPVIQDKVDDEIRSMPAAITDVHGVDPAAGVDLDVLVVTGLTDREERSYPST